MEDKSRRLVPAEDLERLNRLVTHDGWPVFRNICALYADFANAELLKVQPQDQANYTRGVIDTYTTIIGLVETILEENKQYDARRTERERRARTGRDGQLSQQWGNPHFADQFRKR